VSLAQTKIETSRDGPLVGIRHGRALRYCACVAFVTESGVERYFLTIRLGDSLLTIGNTTLVAVLIYHILFRATPF
jgi:hypothetical protein